MQNQKKNGYVLFNLPETSKLKTFILEIRSKENDVPFCIVDAQIETLPKEIELLGDIEFVKGPLLDRDTYQRAQIKQCTTIVVFPIRSGDSTSDSMTQTIVQLCLQFIDLQKTRIIHTLVDAGHEWLFADLKSTQVIENMSLLATVQECQDKYSAEILEQIISNTCGANPNTFEFKKIKNITWGEFNETANKVAIEENIKINILALIQNEKADACPQPQTKITIGDHISILAFHDFSWVRFEEKVLNNI